MYQSIRAAIVALLKDIKDSNDEKFFTTALEYEPKQLAGFPILIVTNNSDTAKIKDTGNNRETYSFTLRIYYELSDDPQDTENSLTRAVEKVRETIRKNMTLGGACEIARYTSGRWLYQDRELPMRLYELNIEAEVSLPR